MTSIITEIPEQAKERLDTQIQWTLDNPINTGERYALVDLAGDSEYDTKAEKVLVDTEMSRKYVAKAKSIVEQFPELSDVIFSNTPDLLYLEETHISIDDLTHILGKLERAEVTELDMVGDGYSEELRIIDGKIYKASSNPSEFSETNWNADGMRVSKFAMTSMTVYESKFTNDSIWFSIYHPELLKTA